MEKHFNTCMGSKTDGSLSVLPFLPKRTTHVQLISRSQREICCLFGFTFSRDIFSSDTAEISDSNAIHSLMITQMGLKLHYSIFLERMDKMIM